MPTLPYRKAHLRILIILLLTMTLVSLTQASEQDEQRDNAELDSMLAPVALYPDTLLSHILIAASYPLEIVQASRWQEQHMDEDNIMDAAEDKDWDPSVKALLPFRDVLKRMSDDLEWTQNLGEAFIADEEQVLARIQVLRRKAYEAGNLYSNDQVQIDSEPEVIRIETVRKEVVYVPYYDTRVVYGDWWWSHHAPHYWHQPHMNVSLNVFWGPSIAVRPYFYFSNFHWVNRHVVVNPHYFYQRPRYYPRHRVVIRDGKRWQHDLKHRRGVRYQQPAVFRKVSQQRVTLNREYTPRPTRVMGKEPRVSRSQSSAAHHQSVQNTLKTQPLIRNRQQERTAVVNKVRNQALDRTSKPTQKAVQRGQTMKPEPSHRPPPAPSQRAYQQKPVSRAQSAPQQQTSKVINRPSGVKHQSKANQPRIQKH